MGSGSGTNRGVPGKSGKNSELPLLRVSYGVSSKPTLETIWYYVSNIHLSAGTLLGVLWRLVQGSGLQVPEPRHRGWEWGRGGAGAPAPDRVLADCPAASWVSPP